MRPAKKKAVYRLKVLLDTNVIISALYIGGKPLEILEMIRSGAVDLWVSPFILNETRHVLERKLLWETKRIISALSYLESCANIVYPRIRLDVVKGCQADSRILEAAVEAKVDFLITGDSRHIQPLKKYNDIMIVSPAEFLEHFFVSSGFRD